MIVAVDTSFLLRLGEADPPAWNLYSAIRTSTHPRRMVATPAVVGALEYLVQQGDEDAQSVARSVWERLGETWQIHPVIPDESQRKVSWIVSYEFMQRQVVASGQRWEAGILGEASVVADLLLADDQSTLADLDRGAVAFHGRWLGLRGLSLHTATTFSNHLKR